MIFRWHWSFNRTNDTTNRSLPFYMQFNDETWRALRLDNKPTKQSFTKISFHARQLHFVTPTSENSSIFREIFHLADGPEKIRENPKLFRRGLDKIWTATTSSKMKQTSHDQFASFSSPSVGIERSGVSRYCGIIRMKQNHWKDLKLSPAGWRDCLSNFFS